MAEQSTSPADSISRPYTYTIGYAMLSNKRDTFVQPSFLDMAAQHGIRLVAVDTCRPLAEQGPFDLIVHKLYGQPWRAQLEAFSALHPDVPVIDPPAAIDRILDRYTMLDVVSNFDTDSIGIPGQVVVHDAAALADPALAGVLGDLRFPLIAKPVEVDGSAASHDLCLVYRREGLHGLRAPLVLQEFVNHGGVLFKIYVVGDHATCVMRSSLPDVPDERLQDLAADATVPFSNISLLPPPAAGDGDDHAKMPPADFVNKAARELRRALGLHLINFDMIRTKDRDGNCKYLILDINYCPGYSKMPGFEPVLTEFFLEMLSARSGAHEQPGPDSGLGVEAR
ncbi:inositol-tetrakisphosphate 1-kinase 4-like [Phragmites australis]|uniref:inositol-tetrakisphosphate 1-kinase 4-like n=1 Tax=Phragmites australis TaxID=29695 RepID=UPI002D781C4C|nr:inositol-tetrakisphosphate 1-kinase 4-like [Phragmites australis]